MSAEDRRRLAALARSLAAVETTAEPDADAAAAAVAAADRDRARHRRPPLVLAPEVPEEGFYRRARALGLRRIRR